MTSRSSPLVGQRGLQRRAVLLAVGLVLLALLINSLFGDHGILHLLGQRRKTQALEESIERLRVENAQLAAEVASLRSDPRTVERLAREELGLAATGETVFLIHHPAAAEDF